MEPENIRALLEATPDRLEKVARKLELPLPIARDIRVQAMNLVLGKCVLCGKRTLAGMCGHCKRDASHRRMIPWSSIKFLKKLNPSDQLLRQTCSSCNGPFMLSARYLLRKLLSNEVQKLKEVCNTCVEKEREAAWRLELQKQADLRKAQAAEKRKAHEAHRKAKEAKGQTRPQEPRKEAHKPATCFYSPFRDNPVLEGLRKELPRKPTPKKTPKQAQKA